MHQPAGGVYICLPLRAECWSERTMEEHALPHADGKYDLLKITCFYVTRHWPTQKDAGWKTIICTLEISARLKINVCIHAHACNFCSYSFSCLLFCVLSSFRIACDENIYINIYRKYVYKYFMRNTNTTRQSEMANTSPATCQCLATFTPLKSKMLIFFSWRHISARSSCYIIN